jgi:hypothetical protein
VLGGRGGGGGGGGGCRGVSGDLQCRAWATLW